MYAHTQFRKRNLLTSVLKINIFSAIKVQISLRSNSLLATMNNTKEDHYSPAMEIRRARVGREPAAGIALKFISILGHTTRVGK